MLQEFVAEVEKTARDVMGEMHTAIPGVIVAFSPGSGMASVKPSGQYRLSNGVSIAYPVISDVPVVMPYCNASKTGLAFPVKAGDSCLIIFSENELDEWRSGAAAEGSLRFDLTSAMAIPGLLRGAGGEALQKACSRNAVVITSGDNEIMLSEDGIAIRGNLKVDGNISYTGTLN